MATEIAIVIVCGLSLISGWYLGKRNERTSHRAQVLEAQRSRPGWYIDFSLWASEALDVLTDADLFYSRSDSMYAVNACRHRLSSLIARGRLFISADISRRFEDPAPNKPTYVRDFYYQAVSYLVVAGQLLAGDVDLQSLCVADKAVALREVRRGFETVVQINLLPTWRRRNELTGILEEFRSNDNASSEAIAELVRQVDLTD